MMINAQDNKAYSEARTDEILKALFQKGETIDSYKAELLNQMPMRELLYLDKFGKVAISRQNHNSKFILNLIMVMFAIIVFGNIVIENACYDTASIVYCFVAMIGLIVLYNKQKRINIGYENYVEVHSIYEYRSKEKYKLSDDIE